VLAIAVIIVSILVVAGSIMWVQPSSRDKMLADLRMKAIKRGIKVQQCHIDDTSNEGRIKQWSRSVMSYRKLVNNAQRATVTVLRTNGESGIYLPDGWVWENDERLGRLQLSQVFELIQKLPPSIISLEFTPGYVGIAWEENDGALIDHIDQWLDQLLQIDW